MFFWILVAVDEYSFLSKCIITQRHRKMRVNDNWKYVRMPNLWNMIKIITGIPLVLYIYMKKRLKNSMIRVIPFCKWWVLVRVIHFFQFLKWIMVRVELFPSFVKPTLFTKCLRILFNRLVYVDSKYSRSFPLTTAKLTLAQWKRSRVVYFFNSFIIIIEDCSQKPIFLCTRRQ